MQIELQDGRKFEFDRELSDEELRDFITRVSAANEIQAPSGVTTPSGAGAPFRSNPPPPTGDTFNANQAQQFESVLRPTLEAVGATIGGIAGGAPTQATTGPVPNPLAPAAILAGAGAGATAGSLATDATLAALREFSVFPDSDGGTIDQAVLNANQALRNELLFGGGFQAGGELLRVAPRFLGKIFGVRRPALASTAEFFEKNGLSIPVDRFQTALDNARNKDIKLDKLLASARRAGVELSGASIAKGARGKIVRGLTQVLGVFPFVGEGARKGIKQTVKSVDDQFNRTLNTLAPTATFADELGVNMFEAAKGTISQFRRISALLYDNVRKVGDELTVPEVFRSNAIRDLANDLVVGQKQGVITLKGGDILEGPVADRVGDFVKKLSNLPDHLSVRQLQSLGDDLSDLINVAGNEGFDVKKAVQLKKSLELARTDIDASRLTREEATRLTQAIASADGFFSKGIKDFQNPTGRKISRVDRNIFKLGAEEAGTINADELSQVVVNLRSPQAISQLRDLVGVDNVNQAARNHIDKALEKARVLDEDGVLEGIDAGKFLDEIGLGKKLTVNSRALDEALKGSNISVKDYSDLVDLMANISLPRDVVDFVSRRVVLGGSVAGVGGTTIFGGVKESLKLLGTAIVLRYGLGTLNSPKAFDQVRGLVTGSLTEQQVRAAFGRAIEAAKQMEDLTSEDFEFLNQFDTQEIVPQLPNIGVTERG